MIENVRVINDNLVDITIPVTDKHNNVQIFNIEGIGPVKATINSTKRSQGAGSSYTSSDVGERNIVFDIQLHGSNVEATRRSVYLYFPIGDQVEMHFKSGSQLYQIYGYVESVNPKIFTQTPTLQVSIICNDPFFKLYPSNNNQILAANVQGTSLSYQGRVDSGVNIQVLILPGSSADLNGRITVSQYEGTSLVRELSIEDFDVMRLTQGKTRAGDLIKISTIPGRKSATLTRSGTTYNIMPAMKNNQGLFLASEQWPLLRVRRNPTFRYSSNRWNLSDLEVSVSWDNLIEGL